MRLSRKRLRGHIAGLALLSVVTATPVRASGSPPAALSNIHIANFGQVDDHYYRGAQPKGDDFRALASLGVKTIIDLAAEGDPAEEAHARSAGMQFVRIPMTTHQAPSPAVIAQFLSLVNDSSAEPVYVHCIGGRHRTGVMTAIYRMTVDQWSAARAFDEMKEYKFGAEFLHPEFKAFIDAYLPGPAPGTVRR